MNNFDDGVFLANFEMQNRAYLRLHFSGCISAHRVS